MLSSLSTLSSLLMTAGFRLLKQIKLKLISKRTHPSKSSLSNKCPVKQMQRKVEQVKVDQACKGQGGTRYVLIGAFLPLIPLSFPTLWLIYKFYLPGTVTFI